MKSNSHLTAITRKALPVPIRWLLRQGNAIQGRVLDYGCGKCADINNRTIGKLHLVKSVTNYDPHYADIDIWSQQFDTILCTYVLCTLPPEDELPIVRSIQSLLTKDGMAFISVRNDKPKQGHGISSRGTLQRWVDIPYLRVLYKNTHTRIYLLTRHSEVP